MSLAAKNYGDALYQLSLKENSLELFKVELKEINEVYRNSHELKGILSHPDISKKDKKVILDKLFKVNKNILIFLKVLIDNNRFNLLEDIVADFNGRANEYLKIEECKVISAVKLNEEELGSIKLLLEEKLNKSVEIKEIIDHDLIAGIRIVLKDEIIDNSIETKLNKLKNKILGWKGGAL